MRRSLCAAVLAALAFTSAPARADETADQLRALMAKAAPSIVTLRVVVRWGGAGGREHRQEMQGAVIDKSGLILCTEGPFGANEHMSVTDLKVVIENEEKEHESFVVANDSKLHIAFIQIEGLQGRELTAVDLSAEAEATPEVGDRVVTVARLDKGYDYAPVVSESRVVATIQKPRKAWATGGVAPGLPCYTPEGKVIGVPSQVDSGVEDGQWGGRGRMFVLPARTIRASVQQAQKKAVELLKTRAEEKAKAAADGKKDEAKKDEKAEEKPEPPKEDEGGKEGDGGFVLCALPAIAAPAFPADDQEKLAALLAKGRTGVVSVRAVLQVKGEVMGRAVDQELRANGHGAVVDGGGLVIASHSLLRPQLRFGGGRGGRGGGLGTALEGLQTTPVSLKIVREGDETEHDAFLVATDTELGLVFLHLAEKPAAPWAAVAIEGDAAAAVGQRVLAVSRLGKAFDYAPFLQDGFVAGEVKKPRAAWILGGMNAAAVLGLPVYDLDGRVLGVLTTLTAEMDEGGERQGTFLLPTRAARTAVLRATERAKELLAERAAKTAEPKKPAGSGEGF